MLGEEVVAEEAQRLVVLPSFLPLTNELMIPPPRSLQEVVEQVIDPVTSREGNGSLAGRRRKAHLRELLKRLVRPCKADSWGTLRPRGVGTRVQG